MKKKLKLNDLKVQSFVTNLDERQSLQAMGGAQSLPCVQTRVLCGSYIQSCVSGCQSCPECPLTA